LAIFELPGNVLSVKQNLSRAGNHHAKDAFDEGGFSATIGANERNALATLKAEAHLMQDGEFAKLFR